MKKITNVAYIYTALSLLLMIMESGRINALILAVVLLWSVYYWIYAVNNYRLPPILKSLNVLLVLFTLYGLVLIISGKALYVREGGNRIVNNNDFLQTIYQSLLPIYAYFVFVKQRLFSERDLKWWIPIFIVVGLLRFYNNATFIEEALETEDFTNGAAYIIVTLIPLVVLYNKNAILQYAILAGLIFVIVLGVKRGAILLSVLSLLYIIWSNMTATNIGGRRMSISRRVAFFVAVGVFLIVMWRYVEYIWEANDYLRFRMEYSMENGAGARESIYGDLFSHFFGGANPFEFLFGMGAYGTLEVTTNLAHNDWLEVMTDEGLIGTIIFALFLYRFYKSTRKYKYDNLKLTYTLCFIIFFVKTFFSMSYSSTPIFLSCAIGVCVGMNETLTTTVLHGQKVKTKTAMAAQIHL